MKKLFLVLCLFMFVGSVSAEVILEQSSNNNSLITDFSISQFCDGTFNRGNSFRIGITSPNVTQYITKISLAMLPDSNVGKLYLHIVGANETGFPFGQDIANGTNATSLFTGWNNFSIKSYNYTVAGEDYMWYLSDLNGVICTSSTRTTTYINTTNMYLGGKQIRNNGAGWIEEGSKLNDLYFRLYGETLGITNYLYPDNDTYFYNNPILIGTTSYGVGYNLTNTTLYVWNSTQNLINTSYNILTGIINTTNWSVFLPSMDLYQYNVLTCGTNGTANLCSYSSSNYTLLYGLNITSQIYSNSSFSGNVENFRINLTSFESLLSATLVYNNTYYSGSIIQLSSDTYSILGSISVPQVAIQQNKNFYWIFNFSDGLSIGDATRSGGVQTVNTLSGVIVASSCNDKAYEFRLYDEENLTQLNNWAVGYNIQYGLASTTNPIITYGNLTGLNNSFYLCINSTLSNNFTIYKGEIFYNKPDYEDRRYYVFNGTIVTNITQNVSLYNVLIADQTSFQLVVQSVSSLVPYSNRYTTLLRWYPNLNQYKVVDMGLTDDTGTTVIHVVPESTDYRIGVYEKNGTLIQLFNPARMICTVNPCTITVQVTPNDVDYTSIFNVQYTLDYNDTSGLWSFIYSDSTQKTDLMNMTIYRDTPTSSYVICSSYSTAYTGVITCNTSAYLTLNGKQRAVIIRTASPPVTIAYKIYEGLTTVFKSSYALWLSLLLAIPIVITLATVSPTGAIIGGVLAFLPALYFGSVNLTIVGALAVLGGIVMHFAKRIQ